MQAVRTSNRVEQLQREVLDAFRDPDRLLVDLEVEDIVADALVAWARAMGLLVKRNGSVLRVMKPSRFLHHSGD